eukprot:11992687-Ditylum_brightwellii.AAC.1
METYLPQDRSVFCIKNRLCWSFCTKCKSQDSTRSPAATSTKGVALPSKSTLLDRPLSSTQSTSTHVLWQTPAQILATPALHPALPFLEERM